MFNHARTLLLNIDGSNDPGPDYLGEELVPAAFKSVELTSPLLAVRSVLFGAQPDRAILNYRIYQLLSLIEKTDLQGFVTDLDPRITYKLGAENTLAINDTWEPVVSQYGGTLDDQLSLVGSPARPDFTGKSFYSFDVSVESASTVRVNRQTPPIDNTVFPFSLTSGLSAPVELKYTGYSFALNTTSSLAAWTVSGYLRPQLNIASFVSTFESLGDDNFAGLFGTERQEPWNTFRNLWYNSDDAVYRLSAIVLALIYQTENLRVNSNG
jgi:hypothetical protein